MLASQLGRNLAPESSSSTPHEKRKTHGEAIFSKTGPHNRPHEFKNQNGPAIPKFIESNEGPYTTYDLREATNYWQQISDGCRKVFPFDHFIMASLQFKRGSGNREPPLNHELKYTMGKVTIPFFYCSSQMFASDWFQKLTVYF